jgi:hypothetical protein
MNGLSVRMILFILVLSALHISGISPRQVASNPSSRLGTKAPQEIAQLRGYLRRTI